MTNQNESHVGHGGAEIAYHVEWGFRREAFVWSGDEPRCVNLHPIATEFRSWLLQKGQFAIFTANDRDEEGAFTNPYTYQASTIAAVLANSINESHAIATSEDNADPLEVELARIRVYTEQVLGIARLCEALIKQLLFCTHISKRHYKKASLGGLLSTECRGCKGSGAAPHKLSLMGSLAHRYSLCLEFEGCLEEHLKIVGRRRNVEAAHSESPLPEIRTVKESRAQLMTDSIEVGEELVHMLRHIGDVEERMIEELSLSATRLVSKKKLLIIPSSKGRAEELG